MTGYIPYYIAVRKESHLAMALLVFEQTSNLFEQ